jgi:hypothetical protein
MLFEFGVFWKTTLLLLATWAFYGVFGFEMTTVTALALILASNLSSSRHLI